MRAVRGGVQADAGVCCCWDRRIGGCGERVLRELAAVGVGLGGGEARRCKEGCEEQHHQRNMPHATELWHGCVHKAPLLSRRAEVRG